MKKVMLVLLIFVFVSTCVLTAHGYAFNDFNDLKSGAWYIDAVRYVYENDIMSGVGNNRFSPSALVTREQMVQVMYKLAYGNISNPYAESEFADVKRGRWYTPAVIWAHMHDITSGIGNNMFGIGQPITREQLAVFIMNYAENSGCEINSDSDLAKFEDADKISSWAVKGMRFCIGQGIFAGKNGSTLDPRGYATRAELAQVLMKFGNWLDKNNAYRLIINDTDYGYVDYVKVKGILPSSKIQLPLCYLLECLGATVEWEDENKGVIAYADNTYIIDLSKKEKIVDSEGNTLLIPAPGNKVYVRAESYELVLDSVTFREVLELIGIDTRIDIDVNNKILTVK